MDADLVTPLIFCNVPPVVPKLSASVMLRFSSVQKCALDSRTEGVAEVQEQTKGKTADETERHEDP